MTHSRAVWLMVAVTAMWSIAGVVARQLESARGFEVTFWRSAFTLLSLLVILPAVQGGRRLLNDLATGGRALWLSGLCWAVMFTAFMLALTLTRVANVLVTMAAAPLLTALVARVFLGDRIAARTWAAIAVAGIGITVIYATELSTGAWLGTLVAFGVPVAAAVNWTVVQRAQAGGRAVSLVPAVLVGAALSSLATLPLALPFEATAHDLRWLALLGLVQLAIPCCLAVLCATVLKAPEVALLALLEVIFGIALAWFGAGEVPGPAVLAGGALVIAALVANEWWAWRQPARFAEGNPT